MGGTIESKNGGIFEKVVFYPLSMRTLKTHFWISSYIKVNIHFEYPPEYPPIRNRHFRHKKGGHPTFHNRITKMPLNLRSKPIQASFLRTTPKPPEISIDCLIIAHLLHTVSLPDQPGMKGTASFEWKNDAQYTRRRLNSSQYAFKCPLTKDFRGKNKKGRKSHDYAPLNYTQIIKIVVLSLGNYTEIIANYTFRFIGPIRQVFITS